MSGLSSGGGFSGSFADKNIGTTDPASTKSLTNTIAVGTTTIAHGIGSGSSAIKSIIIYTSDNRFLNDSFADWYWDDTNIIIDSDVQFVNAKFYIEYIS